MTKISWNLQQTHQTRSLSRNNWKDQPPLKAMQKKQKNYYTTWIHKNFTAINRFYKFYHYDVVHWIYMHSIIYVHIKSVLHGSLFDKLCHRYTKCKKVMVEDQDTKFEQSMAKLSVWKFDSQSRLPGTWE